ncbi:hypothetical protein HFP89_00235 [Wenzhouxiangella sp. XN79A]|uniref:Slp family lipoprotein n=1 Tax=Wenzhouxiangella sp. XN79A TaxID=2724193 RepID=UPI00144A664E|nr:Slp family lipoprotein [Wenzhouxiangella sp. XN79A]NKI33590.1 hypothetical protein [Wenzhouxiangella sp. XN79A]
MRRRMLLPLFLAFAISGCVTIPESLQGDYLLEPLPDSVTEGQQDQPVRWGGLLFATRSEADRTCLELVALPLDRWYRPKTEKPFGGVFLACQDGTLDPNEFVRGRNVTVVGMFEEFAETQWGDEVYRVPMVHVRSVHAWPAPIRVRELDPWDQNDSNRSNRPNDRPADRYINR